MLRFARLLSTRMLLQHIVTRDLRYVSRHWNSIESKVINNRVDF
jgi:hypothetical protein